MLFDEKEMIELCEKYGIAVVENNGVPIFEGEEMSEDFLVSEIMNETYVSYDNNIDVSSKKYSLNVPFRCGMENRNEMLGNTSGIKTLCIKKDEYYNNCTSTIEINKKSKNAFAA